EPIKNTAATLVTAVFPIERYRYVFRLENGLGNTHFQPAEFRQPAETSQTGVTRIRFLLQIVNHLMAVVRTHRDGTFTTLLQKNQALHYIIHVHIPFQMVSLIKIPFRITFRTAQMHKIDTVAETFHHACKVIVGTYAERTGTQAKTVG